MTAVCSKHSDAKFLDFLKSKVECSLCQYDRIAELEKQVALYQEKEKAWLETYGKMKAQALNREVVGLINTMKKQKLVLGDENVAKENTRLREALEKIENTDCRSPNQMIKLAKKALEVK